MARGDKIERGAFGGEGFVMAEPLADQVMRKIDQAAELYYSLLLVVAPTGRGKTSALHELQERTGAPLINVNLEISRLMLDLTDRQRALQLPRLLSDIVNKSHGDVILLDNIEILFDVSLRQDPLRLLQGLSRNKIVVVAWNGSIDNEYLIYATPDHPEYRRYPARDFFVISPKIAA
jgi:hypothetical protein